MAMELGAFTPFLWMIKAREMIWTSWRRRPARGSPTPSGEWAAWPRRRTDGIQRDVRAAVAQILKIVEEVEALLLGTDLPRSPRGIGIISAEDAISLGWTGPCLRACGVRTTSARRTRT